MCVASDVRRHSLIANSWSSASYSLCPSSAECLEPEVQEYCVNVSIRTGLHTSAFCLAVFSGLAPSLAQRSFLDEDEDCTYLWMEGQTWSVVRVVRWGS